MSIAITTRPVLGTHYLGNSDPEVMQVHDLYAETDECRIDAIVQSGTAVAFSPDFLEQAGGEGYIPCPWCFPRVRHD